MKLYVANCTAQAQDFMYRLPEATGCRMQRIEVGAQVQISGDLSQPDIDAIIEQHARYGMVDVASLDRTRPFIGVCYSVGTPVPISKIQYAIGHNRGVLLERGQQIRQESAVALNAQLEEQVPPGTLNQLDISVVEERKDGGTPEVNELTRVTRRTPAPAPAPKRRRVA
jgi:hypothetical protein